MSKPRRVITVIDRHRQTGVCQRLCIMVEALLEEGVEVHYIAAEKLHLEPHENLVPHITPLPVRRLQGGFFWIWFTIVWPFHLLAILLQKRFLSIVVFSPYFSLTAALGSLCTLTPSTLFLRSLPWRISAIRYRSPTKRALSIFFGFLGLLCARRIVASTSAMQDEITEKHPFLKKRVVTLPNAVITPQGLAVDSNGSIDPTEWAKWLDGQKARQRSLREHYDLHDKSVVMVTSGELTKAKNAEYLVRALGAADNERLVLLIAGDGPERAHILTIAVGLGLTSQVVFAGWLEEPGEVLAACQLFVMPSPHEGMSNTMMEALGAGIAVIAADTPEMREILQHDELLLDSKHVGKTADRLNEIASNKAVLQRLQELSQERARHLSFRWGKSVLGVLEAR